jgi:hypothetical protein
MIRTSVPENTIFDTDPQYADIEPDARKFLKLILLTFADMKNVQQDMHLTVTEAIDTLEMLRLKGCVRIVENDGALTLLVTPTGATEAWLSRFR